MDKTRPSVPYGGYGEHVRVETERARKSATPLSSPYTGAPPAMHSRLMELIEEQSAALVGLSEDLHAHPELGFEEHRSIARLVQHLESWGVPARVGEGGLPTAGRADVGGEGPVVGICSEYDALPGIGHACGHNVIAAAGVGATIALAKLMAEEEIPGGVRWLGTPAEEGLSGKEYMAEEGSFDGLAAAMMVHPYNYDTVDQVWLGRRLLTVTITGVAAHASAQPFMGRNALDTATLILTGIGLLRQQMLPVDRIHAVLSDGGERASIIPERAQINAYVRSKYPDTLKDLSQRLEDVCRGAALMTGCGITLEWDEHPASLPVRTNGPLAAHFSRAMDRRGRAMLPGGVVPEQVAASTDFGNVSYRVPGIHPLVKISDEGTALHTTEFAEAACSSAAAEAVVDSAYALAACALDLLMDEALAQAVAHDFSEAGGPVDVPSYFSSPPQNGDTHE